MAEELTFTFADMASIITGHLFVERIRYTAIIMYLTGDFSRMNEAEVEAKRKECIVYLLERFPRLALLSYPVSTLTDEMWLKTYQAKVKYGDKYVLSPMNKNKGMQL